MIKEITKTGSAKKISVAATALLSVSTSAFAASVSTDTIIGKMTTFAITDLWGTIGVTIAAGIMLAFGAWEANKAGNLKPVGYALGGVVLMAGAFAVGPDLYTYIKTATGF